MNIKNTIINIISRIRCRFLNKQDFFVIKADGFPRPETANRKFYDIDNIDDYNKICCEYNFSVADTDIVGRFSSGNHFCVVTEDDHFGCWGWYTTTDEDFYVSEIHRYSPVPSDTAVLFHYYTNFNHRRKGYYYDLLRFVVSSVKKEYAIIYAYDTNPASSNAIKKVGFSFVGRMNHSDFIPFEKMIKKVELEVH